MEHRVDPRSISRAAARRQRDAARGTDSESVPGALQPFSHAINVIHGRAGSSPS